MREWGRCQVWSTKLITSDGDGVISISLSGWCSRWWCTTIYMAHFGFVIDDVITCYQYDYHGLPMSETTNGWDYQWARLPTGETTNGRNYQRARLPMGETTNGRDYQPGMRFKETVWGSRRLVWGSIAAEWGSRTVMWREARADQCGVWGD
jgi:hypothetical protein